MFRNLESRLRHPVFWSWLKGDGEDYADSSTGHFVRVHVDDAGDAILADNHAVKAPPALIGVYDHVLDFFLCDYPFLGDLCEQGVYAAFGSVLQGMLDAGTIQAVDPEDRDIDKYAETIAFRILSAESCVAQIDAEHEALAALFAPDWTTLSYPEALELLRDPEGVAGRQFALQKNEVQDQGHAMDNPSLSTVAYLYKLAEGIMAEFYADEKHPLRHAVCIAQALAEIHDNPVHITVRRDGKKHVFDAPSFALLKMLERNPFTDAAQEIQTIETISRLLYDKGDKIEPR